MRLLILALAMAACGGSRPVPFDANVPTGGVVIYRSSGGNHVCVGLTPCPTRIVQIGDICITETFRDPSWMFEASKPCDGVAS